MRNSRAIYRAQKAAYQELAKHLDRIDPIKFCLICYKVIPRLSRRTKYCCDSHYSLALRPPREIRKSSRWKRKNYQRNTDPGRERPGRDSKAQKATRTHKLYLKMRAYDQMIEELKDERSAISKFIKAIGLDSG